MNKTTVTAGKQILDIITSGMYSNAMMVLREYVQNAADAIDNAVLNNIINYESARIDININGESRTICITDNGSGVSQDNVAHILNSIGVSSKSIGNNRGFRGIGRLGGLGYCDQVVFETRNMNSNHVSIAVWDAKILRNECRNSSDKIDLFDVISKVVKCSKREILDDDPKHFFRVKMVNVHKFHKDDLMNNQVIKDYLSQVAPVPYDNDSFSFYKDINSYLSFIDGYRIYNIYINGDKIFKPHSDSFFISGQNRDKIIGIQLFEIKGRDGACIGRGWFAQSGFKASLLQTDRMRGIRLRQGNIEVGDEYFLADYFSERRFSTWHIGEIHFNYKLRLNARRDGFEQSSDFECFLEQGILLCKHLSNLCRNASKIRSKQFTTQKILEDAENSIDEATFTVAQARKEAIRKAQKLLKTSLKIDGAHELQNRRIATIRNKIDKLESNILSLPSLLDGRILRGIDQKELVEEITARIIEVYNRHDSSIKLVKAIVAPYLRKDVDLK
jgi:hypothetical protein